MGAVPSVLEGIGGVGLLHCILLQEGAWAIIFGSAWSIAEVQIFGPIIVIAAAICILMFISVVIEAVVRGTEQFLNEKRE